MHSSMKSLNASMDLKKQLKRMQTQEYVEETLNPDETINENADSQSIILSNASDTVLNTHNSPVQNSNLSDNDTDTNKVTVKRTHSIELSDSIENNKKVKTDSVEVKDDLEIGPTEVQTAPTGLQAAPTEGQIDPTVIKIEPVEVKTEPTQDTSSENNDTEAANVKQESNDAVGPNGYQVNNDGAANNNARPPRERCMYGANCYRSSTADAGGIIDMATADSQSLLLPLPVPVTAVSAPALPCPAPRRPLRDNKIEKLLFYGSDESDESGDSDGDDQELQPLILPRVLRPYYEPDEDSDSDYAASLVVESSWPPTRRITVPASTEPPTAAVEPPTAAIELPAASVLPSGACFPQKFDFQWRPFPQPQVQPELRRETFSQTKGPPASYADPYDAFVAIWDRPIMEYIARETNRYAQEVAEGMLMRGITPNSRITKWKDTSADELYAYFAIIQATGIVVKSRLEEYWNSSKDIFSTPEFSANMSYDRFSLLSRCLHFNSNALCNPESMAINEAKLFKVLPIVQHLNNKFASLYVLGRNIVLDESLTQGTGRLNSKQHIPNKAAPVGIKTYEICESETGYLWRFEVEARQSSADTQDTNPISGKIPSLVLRLLRGLEHRGHTIWMDNYYNSPALARELKLRGFDCGGTLRTNRQSVPAELTNLKASDMAVGHVCGCTSGDVDIVVWRDKKRIALITTYHGLATTTCNEVTKPALVHDYNICMGGVDKKDQMLAMYPIERSKVWYKKFFRRLLNVSVLNAYILLKTNRQMNHRSFRRTLVVQLLGRHNTYNRRVEPLRHQSKDHLPKYFVHERTAAGSAPRRLRRKCAICSKRTTTYCTGCDGKPLCLPECFAHQHR